MVARHALLWEENVGKLLHSVAALGAVVLSAASAFCQAPGSAIAYTDQVLGGSGGTLRYGLFGYGVLNNAGTTSFFAGLRGPTVTTANDVGIFVGSEDALAMVGRAGQVAPGTGGATFVMFTGSTPVVNSFGSIAFQSSLFGGGSGIWTTDHNGLVVVAATGMPAPGTVSTFRSGGNTTLNAPGQVAFATGLTEGTFANSVAIFGGVPGALTLLARTGAPAPGTPELFASLSNPAINDAGTLAFEAKLSGSGLPGHNNLGIWTASAVGGTNLVIREGDSVGGVAPGMRMTRINGEPSLNAAGEIAFGGSIGVTTDLATALFFGKPGEIRVIATQGDPVAEFNDVQLGAMFPQTVMNGRGQVVLNTLLAGPNVTSQNDDALFLVSTAGKQLLARGGDAAPGTPNGVQFGNFGAGYDLNRYGQVAIRMVLQGSVNQSNDRGVWATDPFGKLVKIAREGDTFVLPNGAARTIAGNAGVEYYHDTGSEGGRRWAFNDAGQIVTSLTFTDGTGAIFLARVGGTARVTAAAPVLGPAVENGFNLVTPLSGFGAISDVSGDIGYLKFAPLNTADGTSTLELNFAGTSTPGGVLRAVEQLQFGAAMFNYTVAAIDDISFEVALRFSGAGTAGDRFFYWNFANIDGVELTQVRLIPEPVGAVFLALAIPAAIRPRRKN